MEIFIVTSIELGWDCIVGCFTTYEKAIDYIREFYDEDDDVEFDETDLRPYVIHRNVLK